MMTGASPKTRERFFNSRQQDWKPQACVYCDSNGHKSTECDKIAGATEMEVPQREEVVFQLHWYKAVDR